MEPLARSPFDFSQGSLEASEGSVISVRDKVSLALLQ